MSSQGQGDTKPDVTKSGDGGGNRYNKKKGRFRGQRPRYVTPKFKGETEALSGQIYDVGRNNQAELFTETTKKLAGYAGRTYKEPQDIRRAIEDVAEINIPMPVERIVITDKKLRDKLYENDTGTRLNLNDGANFTAYGEEIEETGLSNVTKGTIRKKNGQPVKCYTCGGNHYQSDCPLNTDENNDKDETTNITDGSTKDKNTESNTSTINTTSTGTMESPIEATLVGTANVTTGSTNDWGSFNFGGVQFLNLSTDCKNKKSNIHEGMTLINAEELLGKDVSTKLEHVMEQSGRGPICQWWILLDSQSTVDVFCNAKLLDQIHEVPVSLKILSTGGISTTNKIGLLRGYGWVWYHPTGIANILSLSRVKEKFCVSFDSDKDNMFHVHLGGGVVRSYRESGRGLYFSDVRDLDNGIVFVNTVDYNKNKHSRQAYLRALNARLLQNRMGGPSYEHFKSIIRNNELHNCPITETDIDIAEDIFGKSLQCLKGKQTRKNSIHVKEIFLKVPHNILASYGNVTLSADVMSVNGLKFLITHSRHIRFTTTELVHTTHDTVILKGIGNVRNIYKKRGFMVRLMLMDGAFESLRGALAEKHIESNICSENEHVGEIERTI